MKIISNKRAVLTARVGKLTQHTHDALRHPATMPLLIQSFQTHSSSTVPGSGDIGVTDINTSPALIELMGRFEQGDKQLIELMGHFEQGDKQLKDKGT